MYFSFDKAKIKGKDLFLTICFLIVEGKYILFDRT